MNYKSSQKTKEFSQSRYHLKNVLIAMIFAVLTISVSCTHRDNTTISMDEIVNGFYYGQDADSFIYNGNCDVIGLSVKAESASEEGVTIVFLYTPNEAVGYGEIISGERYLIEKKLDDAWIPVEYSTNTIPEWIDVGWTIMNGESYSVTWTDIYGKLDPGMYRIIKPVKCNHKIGDYKTFYIAAEFFVNE